MKNTGTAQDKGAAFTGTQRTRQGSPKLIQPILTECSNG